MLSILGRPDKAAPFCDRFSRRSFLQIGGAALGGLALNQILALEAQAGVGSSHKAIINVYLPGGPPHIDMWDLKPEAPMEIRGEFKPIKTNVPGIEICELFPKIAAMMDKFVIVRSLSDSDGGHDGYQCMTGHKRGDRARRRLSFGRLLGFAPGRPGRSGHPAQPGPDVRHRQSHLGRARHGGLPGTDPRSVQPGG